MALLASAALGTGCGGGGGGQGGAAAPVSATPLAITANNAASVAALAPAIGETVLTVAQFAVDSSRRFATRGNASPSVSACPNGGLLTVTLIDRDGDGVASAGDRISIESRDCAVPVITEVVTGTLQIDLGTPTGLPAGSLRGTVSLNDGLGFGASTTASARMLGSLQFDWSSTVEQTRLHVTASTADDLRILAGGTASGSVASTESIRGYDLTKTLKYDEARSLISMALRYESDALKGSVVVSTPDPLRAYLNTYPEAGRVEVAGAGGSKVVIKPNFTSNSDKFQYALDLNGDGTPDASGSVNWIDAAVGYLWWDGKSELNGSGTGTYATRSFSTTDFFVIPALEWTTSSASSYRLQFSRPLATTTPTLFFRFADQGSSVNDSRTNANIDATAEVHGALIIVKPVAPFRHARYYELQVSLNGTDWGNAVTVQDALGNSTSSNLWPGMSTITPGNLRAIATAQAGVLADTADRLSLSGQTSIGRPRPITSYRWSQVSGTPLRFSDAAAAQTTVAWGDTPPTGVERAVVRLTVADDSGDTDVADLIILSGNLRSSSHVLYFRSAAGDYIGQGATALFDPSIAQFQESLSSGYLRASVITPGFSEWWDLNLASSNGLPLQVGAYENAIRAAFRGNQNGIDFYGSGRGCNETSGRFDVLEIQTDSSGVITRLAVDFEQHCESANAPALLGSYRVNSSVPIRR